MRMGTTAHARWGRRLAACSCVLALGSASPADDARRGQEIRFGDVPDQIATNPPFAIPVSASSGLPVTLAVVSGPAALDGDKIRLLGSAGIVLLRASQPGNAVYLPAPDADKAITVTAPPAAPSFSAQPADRAAAVGETALLSAEAQGSPPPSYQWRKNGIAITGATSPALTFAGVALTDAGTYDVVASNPSGAAVSSTATLTVTKRPQTITFLASSPFYPVGEQVNLSAMASSGLTVGFELVSGMGNLTGSLLTSNTPGTVTVRATQAGDATYAPADPQEQAFNFSPIAVQHR